MSAAVLVLLLLPAACSDDPPEDDPFVYVAVGASDTTGVGLADPTREAWPHVFRRAVLPEDADYTTVGVSGSTVEAALEEQVPRALKYGPDLVTVWLSVNDLLRFVPPATYETQLRELVHALRRGGESTVLVANVPAWDRLPAFAVEAYNAAVERVAAAEGAVLVDLHAERVDPTHIGPDGFHPSAAGHQAIAAVFAAAYERSAAAVNR